MSALALIQKALRWVPERLVPCPLGRATRPQPRPPALGTARGFWWLFWSAMGDPAEPFLAMRAGLSGLLLRAPLPGQQPCV